MIFQSAVRVVVSSLLLVGLSFILGACTEQNNAADDRPETPKAKAPAELIIVDLSHGTGPRATAGQKVRVHYTGWLYSPSAPGFMGEKFDSSLARAPFDFTLGEGMVIQGWDRGVAGMQVGGRRRLQVPPHLAYGSRGRPPVIPPRATLLFEIELLEIGE